MSTVNILCEPSLSRTAFTLLGMEFTRASQVATGMLFHSSMTTSRSWQIFEILHTSNFHLMIPQRCSIWVQVRRHAWPVNHLYPQPLLTEWSSWRCVWGHCHCWNTALLPSFWREGIMLCCSISQYMLEFMFPSMKYNSPTPEALMQP